MPASDADKELVQRIRRGDETAWKECIARYEGRLLAFARSRLRDQSMAEDIVQEAFIGFLNALPNYDEQTPVQSFLFAIAAHKLTDHLRRSGRRPAFSLVLPAESSHGSEPVGRGRVASSLARSREQHIADEQIIANCLRELIQQWTAGGEYERLKCMELLFVRGWANKDVAAELQITEQTVANHKYYVVNKLKEAAAKSGLRDLNDSRLALD